MNCCGTKPPARLSSATSADSRATIVRERCIGGRGCCSSSSPTPIEAEGRGAGKQCGEDGADLEAGEAATSEDDADQYRTEPVGEGTGGLHGEDSACVRAQPRSSNTIAPPLSGQKT